MKKTPWLHSRPYHIGVYERKSLRNNLIFSFWNGKYWSRAGVTAGRALDQRGPESIFQSLPWRGLANPEHNRRPDFGKFVSVVADAYPHWSHRKVLRVAKEAVINRDARKTAGASTKGFEAKDLFANMGIVVGYDFRRHCHAEDQRIRRQALRQDADRRGRDPGTHPSLRPAPLRHGLPGQQHGP